MTTADLVNTASEELTIVGIGASAGGLKSIEAFFRNMPADSGMAFVIIQHLSPDFKSLMTEILSRRTDMRVILATEELTLEPNHIYVIPPGRELRCFGKNLVISDLPRGFHRPIDTFFKSLAANEGVSSIAIVLSGTGSDGAEGIKALHKSGGLTIAESPDSAEFDGMPISAKQTGCVDLVLSPEDMPDALDRYTRKSQGEDDAEAESDLAGVRLIFSLLEQRYHLHFDQYKPRTIARRIERRQALGRFNDVYDYAEHLSKDEQELDDLFHDLLIGVTKFFRDDHAFHELEKQLTEYLEDHPAQETFRVWTIGCASGEEAYSIAMIALDIMEKLGRQPLLKIFATDVHQRTLEIAAFGEYDAETMEFVSLERQQKYFDQLDNGRFRVNPFLRKHLVFCQSQRDPRCSLHQYPIGHVSQYADLLTQSGSSCCDRFDAFCVGPARVAVPGC